MRLATVLLATVMTLSASGASAERLTVDLQADAANPATPQMGDKLSFHSVIRNDGTTPVDGLIAWISLVAIDKGREQPVDLEDWSAHKAVTATSLAAGGTIGTDWPMRLIQAGTYRVVVSVVSRDGTGLTASPFADFTVRRKPVVESRRVLPVAFGVPLLFGIGLLRTRLRR